MTIGYIHLSDIHFGQERGGGQVVIHNDVKEKLLEDVGTAVAKLTKKRADGIIVTGDIAHSGAKREYTTAGDFLDKVASAAGCGTTNIHVVPGNHDIDKSRITHATDMMISGIVSKGEEELERFLESAQDRELLYGRFHWYRPFAEGYDCSLDREGGLASDKTVSLTTDRSLRFVGLNSALICGKGKDVEGTLLLGARQRVLKNTKGQELVVLSHHPLKWLRDSNDARKFVRNRARIFISGHEHKPDVLYDDTDADKQILMLAAGATMPFVATDGYTYTYNLIEFAWDSSTDGLRVTIFPRAWDDDHKEFREDNVRLKGHEPTFLLPCPHFREGGDQRETDKPTTRESNALSTTMRKDGELFVDEEPQRVTPERYPQVLLRFFRDLSAPERLTILVQLNALPESLSEPITQSVERRAFDNLLRKGKLEEVEILIEQIIAQRAQERKNAE